MFFGKYPNKMESGNPINNTNIQQKIISKYCINYDYGIRSYMLMCHESLLEKIKDNQKEMKIKFDVENIKMCKVQVLSSYNTNINRALNKIDRFL